MLTDTVVEILAAENQHRVRGTNIQQQVAEKVQCCRFVLSGAEKGSLRLMKLLRAEFTNFRLLRDLILDFSTDEREETHGHPGGERIREDYNSQRASVGALW